MLVQHENEAIFSELFILYYSVGFLQRLFTFYGEMIFNNFLIIAPIKQLSFEKHGLCNVSSMCHVSLM